LYIKTELVRTFSHEIYIKFYILLIRGSFNVLFFNMADPSMLSHIFAII
jgi:hypothetical protein